MNLERLYTGALRCLREESWAEFFSSQEQWNSDIAPAINASCIRARRNR